MSHPARVSWLALALSLPACSDSSGPDHIPIFSCELGSRYAIGQTVNGIIGTTDCTIDGGDRTADFYQFRQESAGPVALAIESPAGSATITVRLTGPNDKYIDADLVSPGEIVRVGGLLEEGTYVLVVSTEQPGLQSSYTLSSSRSLPYAGWPFQNCTVVQAYTFGSTVNGTLAPGDCVADGGSWMDRHQFTLSSPRTVTINLTSEDFNAYLFLFDWSGGPLAQNNDGGSFRNARVTISLPAGTYSIGAAAFDLGTGAYRLSTYSAN